MKLISWFLVAVTVFALASGQVLFKIAASRIAPDRVLSWLNGPLLAALVVYVIATIAWVGALRALPLRVAYPTSAVSFILVPLLGHMLLNEPLTVRSIVGAGIIVIGVAISVSGS